jgi:glycosyltransferase involved in cell wall biosynthesis
MINMRIVMLTDDRQIDRRIMLEAETLSAHNHEVIILAPWEDGLEKHEICGNIKIERIQSTRSLTIEHVFTMFFIKQVRRLNFISKITQLSISKISVVTQRAVQLFFGFILKTCLFIFRNTCVVLNWLSKITQLSISKVSVVTQRAVQLFFGFILKTCLFIFRNTCVVLNWLSKITQLSISKVSVVTQRAVQLFFGLILKTCLFIFRNTCVVLNWLSKITQLSISKVSVVTQRAVQLFFGFILKTCLFIFRNTCAVLNWLSKITQLSISKVSVVTQRAVQLFFGFILKTCLFIFRNACVVLNWLSKITITMIKKIKDRTAHDEMLYKRACYYNPDIIHVHDLPQLRAGTLVKKILNIPLIYDAHELYPEISTLNKYQKKSLSKLENKLITQCDVVITVNSFIANEMSHRYNIKPPYVVLNATKVPKQFSLNKKYDLFREKLSIPQDKKILLFQGWMSKNRGLQILIQAMQGVPNHIHLVFMGYGEALPELKKLAESLQLEERVHFINAVSQQELLYWIASADAGIIPYQPIDLNNYYCSPNKLFEFIQARIPIVANDLPFLRQMVHDEGIGIVMPLTCQENYAMAIKKIFELEESEPNFRNELNIKAKIYSWDVEEQKLYSIYTQLISAIKGKPYVV